MSVFYVAGALLVLAYNYEHIIPSFVSIFTDVFSGTAATGGFLGATFAFAFNRGVNRGLFSNEAGQGSAPIAHAAARTEEPVSEGVVALLEPFLDTLVICFLTGMTLLSSGVWREKQDNLFQMTDLEILAAVYDDTDPATVGQLHRHTTGEAPLARYTGTLQVENGRPTDAPTILHSRSVAEDIVVRKNGKPYTGAMEIADGKPRDGSLQISGKSLIHSAPLSTVAFSRSFLGDWGKYIVSISLLFFAFSTAIAWSYYGDRSVIFLGGRRYVLLFRIIYCVAFFIASFTDTTIIWNLANVAIVLMTLPNLIGMLTLRKEMKKMERAYRETLSKK
jgi:AGCS family alanine or glycine:cation symporter